uniref:Ig-like domain-containing protein n=1 Tax=Glossina brevipalpis TaxID=37001 RepID=A0A1A9WDU3_9MUSC
MCTKRIKFCNDATAMELTLKSRQRQSPQKQQPEQQQQQRRLLLQSYKYSKRRKCKTKSKKFDFIRYCKHSIWSNQTQQQLSRCLLNDMKATVNDLCCPQSRCKTVNKLILIATMSLIIMTSTRTICHSEAAPVTSTQEVFNKSPRDPSLAALPSTSSYTSAVSSASEEKLQQQQLFALLNLNRRPLPTVTNAVNSLRSPSTVSLMNHVQSRPLYQDDNELDFPINGLSRLETTGFAADEAAVPYGKTEKHLTEAVPATAKPSGSRNLQEQRNSSGDDNNNNNNNRDQSKNNINININNNNNNNCPKECKCLNDYFDCGKKQLDHVPALPAYVQIIDLINNKLNDTTVLQIRNLPELSKLVLKRNQLETMPKFTELPVLKHLNLAHNRIQRISSEALMALPKLKSLDLSKNYLHILESGYFPQKLPLAHLFLNFNEISTIDDNALDNLPNLLDLELNGNRLFTLPAGVFRNLAKLRKLSLNNNHLEINWSTFRGLHSLQKLFLKSNNIRALQDGVFHVMHNIETIELDNNGISSLSRQGLFNLTKLHHLSLLNNSISRIESDTWEFTQSLISLDLSHNNITEFKPQHLDCLQRLKTLNLGHNKIQYFLETTFDCVKNLEDLNLRRNKLSWIIEDPGVPSPFKALRKLKKLDLYGNNLKQINVKSLSGLGNLEFLNLGGNALASIQTGAFDHMTQLQKLVFKSLNFICDCNISWFKSWLQRHYETASKTQVQTVSAQAVCGYPEHLLDRELMSLNQNELVCGETPKPILIQEPIDQLTVKGSNVTIECTASSPTAASLAAADELKIKWRHDNQNIKEQERHLFASNSPSQNSLITTETQIYYNNSNETSIKGYLRLFNVSYESAGRYQCVVSNAFGTTYSQKFKISIGIRPSFMQIPSNLTVDTGDTARLVCSAAGDPMPDIALQKFGASDFPAATERRLQVIREENAFVITNAKPNDSGIYTCTAESAAGDISINASLLVNDKPLPTIPRVHKEIVLGKSSVLECLNEMALSLTSSRREWFKDNKPFHITSTFESERYYFTAEKELLIIVNTQSMDAGQYRCEITDNTKTYAMHIELIVVKENLSQTVIIVGVAVVTICCIIIGSLIVWIILYYQKKKLFLSGGGGVGGGGGVNNGGNVLRSSGIGGSGARVAATSNLTLDQTQLTPLNRTYLRRQRNNFLPNQRPRSLAALELHEKHYKEEAEDYCQTLAGQRSCLIVTTTPNYRQLLIQKRNESDENGELLDEEHLTLEYLRRNSPHDFEHQQDHLSSKDSGTGSDAAVKRSMEDFNVTLLPPISTNMPHDGTVHVRRSSSPKLATDEDDETEEDDETNVSVHAPIPSEDNQDDFITSPTLGISEYDIEMSILTRNNNHESNNLLQKDSSSVCSLNNRYQIERTDSKGKMNISPSNTLTPTTPTNCKTSTNYCNHFSHTVDI